MDRRAWRTPLAAVAGIVAIAGLVGGGVGLWTWQVATDSDRFQARVETILRNEDESDALAQLVVDEIAAAVNLESAVDRWIPDLLQPAADLVLQGARTEAQMRLAEYIRSDTGSAAIASAMGFAHRQLIDLLEGDGLVDGITIEDGAVRLNILPLISLGLTEIQKVGLLTNIEVPPLDRSGNPDEQRAELSAALGVDLPDTFGTPVVYRSDRLDEVSGLVEQAQRVFVLAERAVWVLLIGGMIAAALSVWLSLKRIRAVVLIGAGAIAMFLVVLVIGQSAGDRSVGLVQSAAAQSALGDILADLTTSLSRTIGIYVFVVLVIMAISIWTMSRRSAQDAGP